jgi:TRAP-type C4-dicarboxylate transport system substrate-binding protein
MKIMIRAFILILCIIGAAGLANAQNKVRINLGTVAPNGSLWHQVLLKMSENMEKVSGGKVIVRIYEGGRQGDEEEMRRKALQGTTLQAVALSGVGLAHVDKSVAALQIPLLLDSYGQLDYIRKKISPKLEKAIEKQGFIVLNWSDVGWVHFFSKKPIRKPDDLRAMRLFTSAGDSDAEKLYTELRLTIVPIGADELVMALQTGRIDAFDVPPLFALANQSFALANNMIDMKWVPLSAATLVSKKTWEKIPEALRPKLLEVARKSGDDYRQKIRKSGEEAVTEMVKRGLNVIKLTDAEKALWRKEVESAYPKMRGTIVPAELFDEVVRLSKEYRAPTK